MWNTTAPDILQKPLATWPPLIWETSHCHRRHFPKRRKSLILVGLFCLCTQRKELINNVLSVGGTPKPFITAYRPIKDEFTEDNSNRDSVEILPRPSPSDLALSSLYPKEADDFSTTKFPTAQRLLECLPKNLRQPSTGLLEQRSPHRSARARKIPIMDGKKPPRKDAYDISVADPDEEWSTLPFRKKFKPRFEVTKRRVLLR